MYYYIIGFTIVLIILIINNRIIENKLLTGFWKGDPEFCDKSETDLFLLYLGSPSIFSMNGYILVKNSEGLIMNDPFSLSLSGLSLLPWMSNERNYNVTFKWLDNNQEFDFFPSKQSMCYYPLHGKLVLYKNDQVYAILFKDTHLSCVKSDNPTPESIEVENASLDIPDL